MNIFFFGLESFFNLSYVSIEIEYEDLQICCVTFQI